jgi:hypothetical protein
VDWETYTNLNPRLFASDNARPTNPP